MRLVFLNRQHDPGYATLSQETFRAAMRSSANEYEAADGADPDKQSSMDFDEFCTLVQERETGEHLMSELRTRFLVLDTSGSGRIEKHEYLRTSMKDALKRNVTRIREVFAQWDADCSGSVTKREFQLAMCALGFDDVPREYIDMVFDELDVDTSGQLSYFELDNKLRKLAGASIQQGHDLRRLAGG